MKKYPHITVSKGLAGWFAVEVWWNKDYGGFAEPYETGVGRYETQVDAIEEAEQWAEESGLRFYPPKLDEAPARQDVENQLRELIPEIEVHHIKGQTP